MTRLLVLLVAVGMLSGCRGPNAATPVDPFGRTRVAPPRTGCISGQPAADPYYSGTRQADATDANPPQSRPGRAFSATTATAGTPTPPDGSHNSEASSIERSPALAARGPGDLVTIPSDARTAPDSFGRLASRSGPSAWQTTPIRERTDGPTTKAAATSGAVATAGSSPSSNLALAGGQTGEGLAGRERIIRTIQPRPKESGASWSRGVFARPAPDGARRLPPPVAVPTGTIDIMDLPQTGASSRTQFRSDSSRVRLVSGVEELKSSSAGQIPDSRRLSTGTGGMASGFSSRARYGHDPDYRWLRGKLEYSQIERRWKLRYIPIDGATDEYGGSVVFSDSSLLAGCERGDFVEVRGQLGDATPGDGSYAPDFTIREIERFAD